jgi:hypothetical protein
MRCPHAEQGLIFVRPVIHQRNWEIGNVPVALSGNITILQGLAGSAPGRAPKHLRPGAPSLPPTQPPPITHCSRLSPPENEADGRRIHELWAEYAAP